MEQTREETLSTLYSLRAGLSIMSEIADRGIVAKKEIEDNKYQKESFSSRIHYIQNSIALDKKHKIDPIYKINQSINEKENRIRTEQIKLKQTQKKIRNVSIIFLSLIVIIAVLLIIPQFISDITYDIVGEVCGFLIIPVSISLFFLYKYKNKLINNL